MLTVEQVRQEVAPFVMESGKCADAPSVLQYINLARQLLWHRGDWKETLENICVQTHDGFLTLPYDYLRIKDAKTCGGFAGIDTEWYELTDQGRIDQSCAGDLIDIGDQFATFKDYYFENEMHNFRIAFMAEADGDKGKKITFNAIGEHNDRISLVAEIGEDHEKLTLNPWIKYFRHATKDQTIGRVRVYIYDPNRNVMDCCAIYEPDDLNPRYRRYRTRSCSGRFYRLRCKKRYRPLLRESDPVEFETDALIQAMIALNARRAKDASAYSTALALALDNLNQVNRDYKHDGAEKLRLSRGHRVENLNQMRFCPHPLQ